MTDRDAWSQPNLLYLIEVAKLIESRDHLAPEHIDLADARRRIRLIFVGSAGNLVEWYDFYSYTAFSLYFASSFFPDSEPSVQQLDVAVLFAATFLMRPFGGWLFGYIGDRFGRRRVSLMLSVVCMCFGSLIIATTPTYAIIGIAAPALLALARIIEGLSRGGEYGASAIESGVRTALAVSEGRKPAIAQLGKTR